VVGEKITLMKWGNTIIKSKDEKDGQIVMTGELILDDTDYKKTKKLTWITDDPNTNFEVTLVELDHLITKDKLEEEDKIEDFVDPKSKVAYPATADGPMRMLRKGDKICWSEGILYCR